MTARRRVAIVIDARDPAIVAEAWRAAVGVSLRGAAVAVATVAASADAGADAARARATLALFGHDVDGDPAALAADVIELWRDDDAGWTAAAAAPARPTAIAHLVRSGRAAAAVAARDRVLQLDADVDYAAVLDAIAAADAACVW